ncbi:hypothetical protein MYP_1746 [Sporocytophaga myxococcoides]|uniref:Uncharacterized protein n=1 Tax=Sporocytophaga myxococcoides TaxID=153721 RepID=A0A098LE68_9BACT|nr:hypothetical protein [Sporocytophaga myxococcoides]GAL84518.1 hypothetical protein MYP_1746 [Sporocytophaga myxococcoides]
MIEFNDYEDILMPNDSIEFKLKGSNGDSHQPADLKVFVKECYSENNFVPFIEIMMGRKKIIKRFILQEALFV